MILEILRPTSLSLEKESKAKRHQAPGPSTVPTGSVAAEAQAEAEPRTRPLSELSIPVKEFLINGKLPSELGNTFVYFSVTNDIFR